MAESFMTRVLDVGGIAGVIALIIVSVISYRYMLNGAEEIPDALSFSLTAIIGFYFGTAIRK